MSSPARPRLLYVVPGHDFLPSAGPTRNVLNQARALSDWADVTLVFRRVAAPAAPGDPPIIEIDPAPHPTGPGVDDAATRGMSYRGFLAYVGRLRRLLAQQLPTTDLLLEKDWMLTGYASRQAGRHGIPGIPVKNWVAGAPPTGREPVLKRLKRVTAAWAEGRLLRRLPWLVAETPYLRSAIASRWDIPPERIAVIGLGVDRDHFRPGDRDAARAALGIDPAAMVLLYAGVLDRTHDLEPLLQALLEVRPAGVELHVIGDGARRAEYQRLAQPLGDAVRFHGRVPYQEVPVFLASADCCVAPYDPAAFPGGEVAYSTLKVREYLSAGRPVATVDSGTLRELIRPGQTGFLLRNHPGDWARFLAELPPRERLAEMGRAAAGTDLSSWADVAEAYRRLWLGQGGGAAADRDQALHHEPAGVRGG